MIAPNTRTQFSPTTRTVRDLRSGPGVDPVPHELLPPEAGLGSTVRFRTHWDGTRIYFAKIGDHVFDWAPIQGAWVRPL